VLFLACAKEDNQQTIQLTIDSWGNGAPELSISVPSGYALEKFKGPDFDVHYIKSKNPHDPSMRIYIGHHPKPFSSQKEGIETEKEADVILGQKVEWRLWQEKENGKTTYHCETIVLGAFQGMEGGGVAILMVHVFMNGEDRKRVAALKTYARSLQIVGKGQKSTDSSRMIFPAQETEKIGHIFGGKAPFWTPTDDQVQELESLLLKYLQSHPPVGDKPVGDLSKYGRQYFGMTKNNRRLIYLNAFCNPSKFDRREREIVIVKDGGSCYFQISFDPAKKDFTDLQYNGRA
jgi:hypothetical protein